MANIIFMITAMASMVFGVYIYIYPMKAFEKQKQFYALINWRIEPIDVKKEIRNTKGMGIFVICFTVIAIIYYYIR